MHCKRYSLLSAPESDSFATLLFETLPPAVGLNGEVRI